MKHLGVLATILLLATAPLPGCATGRPPATPLHRAGVAAVVFVDAGTWVSGELSRHIEADLAALHAECEAQADASRDCDAAVRYRATEYAATVAAHSLYATLVGQLVGELAAQARRQQAGEDPDLGDAIRLAGRALSVYRALSATLRTIGIEAPPISLSDIAALVGEVTP